MAPHVLALQVFETFSFGKSESTFRRSGFEELEFGVS